MITGVDHVQLAMPRGREDAARSFYGRLLGMTELAKPPALAARGGCWFASGVAILHLGVEEPFTPARKAHPALLTDDLDGLESVLTAAGHECVRADGEIPGVRRFHTRDPFGNRVEFQQDLARDDPCPDSNSGVHYRRVALMLDAWTQTRSLRSVHLWLVPGGWSGRAYLVARCGRHPGHLAGC